jgi:CRP/FNR family transcriptional regulator, cyclic AMP receptor protein
MNESITPEFLRTLAFLAAATDEDLQLLVPAMRIEPHSAGGVLFREGTYSGHAFIVAGGIVALEINGPGRRPRRFQTVGPGELLGWSPLLGSGPMTATARALTDVRVVVLQARAVLDLCARDPRFGFQFMQRTAAAVAARLSATRLQLLDVYRHELPPAPPGGEA